MNWIRKINPKTRTVEAWMRENEYTGDPTTLLLKVLETNTGHYEGRLMVDREKVLALLN